MARSKIRPLVDVGFKFFGTATPNVFEIDDEGKFVSRPHIGVSKIMRDGSRYFEVKIFRAGKYNFSNFTVDKHHPLYLAFINCRTGWFVVDEARNIFVEKQELPLDN